MSKGEWLLRHYNEFKSRAQVLTARLSQLKTNYEKERIKDEWILSTSLGKSLTEEYIKGQGFNSKTESIALKCESAVNSDIENERLIILHELTDLVFCTHLCESILTGLNEAERWIITARFIEGKTLDTMVESQPQGLYIYSRQTMGKRCRIILGKIDCILYGIDLPEGLYNESASDKENINAK